MEAIDKFLFSRKLQFILLIVCLIGVVREANLNSDYSLYVFLLQLGVLSSIFTIVVKTVMSKKS